MYSSSCSELGGNLKQLWPPKDITRRHAGTKLGQETDVSELGSKLFKERKLYDHSSVEPSRRARSRTQRRATSAAPRSRPLPPAAPAAHRCAIESHFHVMASRDREIGFWARQDPFFRDHCAEQHMIFYLNMQLLYILICPIIAIVSDACAA